MVKYTVSQQVRSVMGMPIYLARLARFNLGKNPISLETIHNLTWR